MADNDDLRAQNLAFYQAFEAKDLDAMASVWGEESPVSCVHPGWDPIVGRDAVLESWEAIFLGTRAISFTLRNAHLVVSGDAAWIILVEEIDAAHEDGERVRAATLATNVFLRETTGWRLVHHHAGPAVSVPTARPSDRALN